MSAPPTDLFYELTPQKIHRAFESAGLRLEPTITFLNSLENRVVRVQDVEGERWLARRRRDPAFQRLFSDVGTHAFWRRELEELQQQLEWLNS